MVEKSVGIGLIGAGYMGKAHAVAMAAVGAVFDPPVRPRLEIICTRNAAGAADYARQFGFARSTSQWQQVVADPKVDAVIIASPQQTHREIALAAFHHRKAVFCEKPLGASLADSRMMLTAAEQSGMVHMTGFNYIRTPASQLARQMISAGEIGTVTYIRGEHTEDFLADPMAPANWRTEGRAEGNMGDLAPHIINAVLALGGPIHSLIADIQTVHASRPSATGMVPVTNDDQAHLLCRFASGAMGSLFVSRIATGRKMGYAYDIYGTKGAIRFDGEDQNALWLYKGDQRPDRQGFTKILTGPEHPDYKAFSLGPGHGTGYQDQIIIEARDFLLAIAENKPRWPSFQDGMIVNQIIEAAFLSHAEQRWVDVGDV
jgi:predicted dehydrogenase